MGRGRGKGKRLTAVTSHEDPGSGGEEPLPAYKRRGRPTKPLKMTSMMRRSRRSKRKKGKMLNLLLLKKQKAWEPRMEKRGGGLSPKQKKILIRSLRGLVLGRRIRLNPMGSVRTGAGVRASHVGLRKPELSASFFAKCTEGTLLGLKGYGYEFNRAQKEESLSTLDEEFRKFGYEYN
ncbi:hypothetical protein QJS10_CPB19g01005 [Acorus calamus]|uniref:Uncharacterized protein n=1 Tax=Acorus calamus TaxID=4465 RepID=A0AAV9CE83_ACOCL|nr:hypothetical protein QJS10_CPB19g01005 [Acorus calamus]